MCSKSWSNDKIIMCKSLLSWKIFNSLNCLSKMVKMSLLNVIKELPDVKTSGQNQQICQIS